jgi:DNA-binding CsgD family transcriptional regulator
MSSPMNVINEDDARAMVRLLGETAACPGGHQDKKRFLMNGLSALVGADAWLWALTCRLTPGEPQIHVGYVRDGFEEEQFTKLLKIIEHPAIAEGSRLFFESVVDTMEHTTMTRLEMDPEQIVARSEVQQSWDEANLGDMILSGHPLDSNSLSGIGIYRRKNGGSFTDREKRIAHIVLSEVPWLHMADWPEDRGANVPKLYPRQRMVLNLLLDGLGRKQISHHLEITENTVAGYVKELYKHFGVQSQPELMRKFLTGQSGN